MKNLTIQLGLLLILIGATGYVLTSMQSMTALIPAFIGIAYLALGFLSNNPKQRQILMHIAQLLAVVTIAATFSGVVKLFAYFGGAVVERLPAVIVQAVTALLNIVYLVLGINSFVQARLKKEQAK